MAPNRINSKIKDIQQSSDNKDKKQSTMTAKQHSQHLNIFIPKHILTSTYMPLIIPKTGHFTKLSPVFSLNQ